MRRNFPGFLVLAAVLTCWCQSQAQPTLVSTVPTDGATGVPTNTTIVFTFSEAMDTTATEATFFVITPFAYYYYTTTPSWSVGDTVLTCAPVSPFPANKIIYWTLNGQNPGGDRMEGALGSFTTGAGSGGSGTNAITTFSVGKVYHYNQTSSGSPTLDPTTPYDFSGVTALASNRTATSVVLTLPTLPSATVSNLTQLPLQPEIYIVYGFDTSLSAYDAAFPAGAYSFLVQAASSNQTVVVNLPSPASLAQPGAPHLTNYPAAQVVDPSQAFVLGWDAFAGGTAADYIDVDIGTAYGSPNPGLPGALAGTARTFTIPAGTLQPNSTYFSRVGFFHYTGATNVDYATAAYRATYTEFPLITTGSGQLVLTNASYLPGIFSFDVLCTNGQTVTVEYTNVLTAVHWTKLLTTNSPGTRFHIDSPQAGSNRSLFYRARNGP